MAGPLNHVVIAMPRSGTSSDTVDPATASGGSVVGGATFSPTSGRMLVCAAYGSVTSGSTTGVPANAPTGWTKGTEAVNNGGLYVWYRTASATTADRVVANHNASNYPMVYEFWEFDAGTTWSGAVNATNVFSGGAGPNLTGLSGTNWTCGLVGVNSNGSATSGSVSWNNGTEQADAFAAKGGSTDGYLYSSTAVEDDVATSRSFAATPTVTANAAERIVFAVKVTSGPTVKTGTDAGAVTDTGAETATDTGTDTSTVTDTGTDAATLAGTDTVTLTETRATALTAVDSSSVTEVATFTAVLTGVDAGTVTEVGADQATLAGTDTGSLVDSSGVIVGGLTLNGTDSGAMSDTAALAATLAAVEAGTLAEAAAIAAVLAVADTATQGDGSGVTVNGSTITGTDTVTMAEVALLAAAASLVDPATLAELATLAATDTTVDTWTLTDSSGVSQSSSPTASDTATQADSAALVTAAAIVDQFTLAELVTVAAATAGIDTGVLAELAAIGLPAADVPPHIIAAAGADARVRAVGRLLSGLQAVGRTDRYSARGRQ